MLIARGRHPEVFAKKSVGQVADHFDEAIGGLGKKPAVMLIISGELDHAGGPRSAVLGDAHGDHESPGRHPPAIRTTDEGSCCPEVEGGAITITTQNGTCYGPVGAAAHSPGFTVTVTARPDLDSFAIIGPAPGDGQQDSMAQPDSVLRILGEHFERLSGDQVVHGPPSPANGGGGCSDRTSPTSSPVTGRRGPCGGSWRPDTAT